MVRIVFTLHDTLIVRLNEFGEECWQRFWRGELPKSRRKAQTRPDGRIEFKVWEAMEVFGSQMLFDCPNPPFEDMEIELKLVDEPEKKPKKRKKGK